MKESDYISQAEKIDLSELVKSGEGANGESYFGSPAKPWV